MHEVAHCSQWKWVFQESHLGTVHYSSYFASCRHSECFFVLPKVSASRLSNLQRIKFLQLDIVGITPLSLEKLHC